MNAGTGSALQCTVRGCELPLAREQRAWRCAAGHSFDVARAGYVSLLQPQDRRSLAAGDARAAVEARLRLIEHGADRELRAEVVRWVGELLAGPERAPALARPRVLELGTGPGVLLAELAAACSIDAFGLDLSGAAIERAARACRDVTWIVANADRRVPFPDRSLDLALSMRAPKPAAELARVLRPDGRLLVGVPAPDDLEELRRATAGAGLPRDPADRALAAFEGAFELLERRDVRQRITLGRAGLADLLASTYRGARRSEAERAAELRALEVTQATTLMLLRPREL